MSTRLSDYDYELPRELIAQRPLPRREDSRMMVLRRDEQKIEHARFVDLKKSLRDPDLLVLNDSRVLPARHFSDDGKLEFLFLKKIAARRWKALVKPGRRFGRNDVASIQGVQAEPGEIFADGSREVILAEDVDLLHGGAIPCRLTSSGRRPQTASPAKKMKRGIRPCSQGATARWRLRRPVCISPQKFWGRFLMSSLPSMSAQQLFVRSKQKT